MVTQKKAEELVIQAHVQWLNHWFTPQEAYCKYTPQSYAEDFKTLYYNQEWQTGIFLLNEHEGGTCVIHATIEEYAEGHPQVESMTQEFDCGLSIIIREGKFDFTPYKPME